MSNKTKIGIVVLILGAFVVGGFAFNAFNAGALINGKFFHKGDGDYEGMMEEWKKHKAGWMMGMKKYSDEINHEAIILDNGIQITITSDNPDIIQMLHDFVGKINNYLAK